MKMKYPPADPAHLCRCECHVTGGLHFMACCDTCECGAHVDFRHLAEHRKTCRPTKNRHRDREATDE